MSSDEELTSLTVNSYHTMVAGGKELPMTNAQVEFLGQGSIFGFPMSGAIMLATFILCGADEVHAVREACVRHWGCGRVSPTEWC